MLLFLLFLTILAENTASYVYNEMCMGQYGVSLEGQRLFCRLHVLQVSLWVLELPPTVQKHAFWEER